MTLAKEYLEYITGHVNQYLAGWLVGRRYGKPSALMN